MMIHGILLHIGESRLFVYDTTHLRCLNWLQKEYLLQDGLLLINLWCFNEYYTPRY